MGDVRHFEAFKRRRDAARKLVSDPGDERAIADMLRALDRADGLVPAHDLEAERAVLSRELLADASRLPPRTEELRSDDFFAPLHARIWRAISVVRSQGEPVDLVTVAAALRADGGLAKAELTQLPEIIDGTPAVANVDAHVRIVRDLARQRRIVAAMQAKIASSGYSRQDNLAGWAAEIADGVRALAGDGVKRPPITPSSVLEMWGTEGALVHVPTGFAKLDELTGGGPVLGSRWYLMGAPDAGKTAMLVQVADQMLARGLVVGLLAVDEDAGDVLMRFLQRRGFTRAECEARDPSTLALMRDRARELERLRFYDASWTIERAAADVAEFARALRRPAMLGIDSIQTATCDAEAGAASTREAVTARSKAIRDASSRYRLLSFTTSEMGRHAYRSVDAAEQTNDLASAKESGAIEYSARVLLALRSVQGEPDLLELRIAKNKHGPTTERVGLRIDRRLQELTETDAPEPVDLDEARREARTERARGQTTRDAAALAAIILDRPGIGTRDLEGALRVVLGECGIRRQQAAFAKLDGAAVRLPGKGKQVHHYLEGAHLPADVVAELDVDARVRASRATAPEAHHAA